MEQKELKMGEIFTCVDEVKGLLPKGYGIVVIGVNCDSSVQVYSPQAVSIGINKDMLDDNFLGARLRYGDNAKRLVA